ncbi:hypothetical protein K432DRAFT_143059 [Lepidopterella palustris CBS 459.81]|uniref:Uncharacterized protein n=1 Tax=Lepidopterella palustris CBS 459.81 TaxID=1314670 RepID=A0A8E2ELS1_9PEZI|nr:hypothetical protein K432DRAFT_143059 [Lepidopterella palustris CBS 459.81]
MVLLLWGVVIRWDTNCCKCRPSSIDAPIDRHKTKGHIFSSIDVCKQYKAGTAGKENSQRQTSSNLFPQNFPFFPRRPQKPNDTIVLPNTASNNLSVPRPSHLGTGEIELTRHTFPPFIPRSVPWYRSFARCASCLRIVFAHGQVYGVRLPCLLIPRASDFGCDERGEGGFTVRAENMVLPCTAREERVSTGRDRLSISIVGTKCHSAMLNTEETFQVQNPQERTRIVCLPLSELPKCTPQPPNDT